MSTTKQTSRLAGIAYLGLLISGVVGFLVIRSQLVVPGDAAATAANLVENEFLARLGIAADLTIVLTQSLAALYFFKLFQAVNAFAAASLAAFGFVNSAAILVATALSATALQVAVGGAALSSAAVSALLLYDLNGALWNVAALFFGLWLIPMGWLVLRSRFMPRLLGWVLIAGGIGYAVNTYHCRLTPGRRSSSAMRPSRRIATTPRPGSFGSDPRPLRSSLTLRGKPRSLIPTTIICSQAWAVPLKISALPPLREDVPAT